MNEIKSRLRPVRILSYVFLLLGGLFLLFTASVSSVVEREVPDLAELCLQNTAGDYTFSVFELAQAERYESDRYVFSCAHEASVTVAGADAVRFAACAVYCDGDYAANYGLTFLAGAFFPKARGAESPNLCVLDSNLAAALFPDADPLGQEIRIGNDPYTVCGVTAVYHDLLSDAVRSDAMQIYLPYGTLEGWRGTPVDRVGIRFLEGCTAALSAVTSDVLYTTGGTDVITRDYRPERPICLQFPALCRGLAVLTSVLTLLFAVIALVRSLVRRLSGAMEERYFGDAMRSRKGAVAAHVTVGLLFLAGGALLCVNGFVMPLVKDKWISYDNLFDLSYYCSVWADALHLRVIAPLVYRSAPFVMLHTAFRLQLLTLVFGGLFYLLGILLYRRSRYGIVCAFPGLLALTLAVPCAAMLCAVFGIALTGGLILYGLLALPVIVTFLEDLVTRTRTQG